MNELTCQHDDDIDEMDNARNKYVSRQLFRDLVAQGRSIPSASKSEEASRQ